MGEGYLIDTNIVIAALAKKLPREGDDFIRGIGSDISVITQIELLRWHNISSKELDVLSDFVRKATIYSLTLAVIEQLSYSGNPIKTPDAIIAATALVNNLTLLTRNLSDFKQIPNLKIINPFDL